MKRVPRRWLSVLLFPVLAQAASADTDSLFNKIGAPGDFYPSVASSQFMGARFAIASPMTLTSAGIELRNSNGSFFVAVVPLGTMTSVPMGTPSQGIPFNNGEVIHHTVFSAETGSTPVFISTPMSFNLSPGIYGIIFGTGLFEAVGWGQTPGYAKTTGSSSFFWSSEPWRWQDNSVFPPQAYQETKIGITIATVPEPTCAALLLFGLTTCIRVGGRR